MPTIEQYEFQIQKNAKEFISKEVSRINNFAQAYVTCKNLLNRLESHEECKKSKKWQQRIESLKTLIEPYQTVYLFVGNNKDNNNGNNSNNNGHNHATHNTKIYYCEYLLKKEQEIILHTFTDATQTKLADKGKGTSTNNVAEILVDIISTDAFYEIRKAAALGSCNFEKVDSLLTIISRALGVESSAKTALDMDIICAVQILTQLNVTIKDLLKNALELGEKTTIYTTSKLMSDMIAFFGQTANNATDIIKTFEGLDDKINEPLDKKVAKIISTWDPKEKQAFITLKAAVENSNNNVIQKMLSELASRITTLTTELGFVIDTKDSDVHNKQLEFFKEKILRIIFIEKLRAAKEKNIKEYENLESISQDFSRTLNTIKLGLMDSEFNSLKTIIDIWPPQANVRQKVFDFLPENKLITIANHFTNRSATISEKPETTTEKNNSNSLISMAKKTSIGRTLSKGLQPKKISTENQITTKDKAIETIQKALDNYVAAQEKLPEENPNMLWQRLAKQKVDSTEQHIQDEFIPKIKTLSEDIRGTKNTNVTVFNLIKVHKKDDYTPEKISAPQEPLVKKGRARSNSLKSKNSRIALKANTLNLARTDTVKITSNNGNGSPTQSRNTETLPLLKSTDSTTETRGRSFSDGEQSEIKPISVTSQSETNFNTSPKNSSVTNNASETINEQPSTGQEVVNHLRKVPQSRTLNRKLTIGAKYIATGRSWNTAIDEEGNTIEDEENQKTPAKSTEEANLIEKKEKPTIAAIATPQSPKKGMNLQGGITTPTRPSPPTTPPPNRDRSNSANTNSTASTQNQTPPTSPRAIESKPSIILETFGTEKLKQEKEKGKQEIEKVMKADMLRTLEAERIKNESTINHPASLNGNETARSVTPEKQANTNSNNNATRTSQTSSTTRFGSPIHSKTSTVSATNSQTTATPSTTTLTGPGSPLKQRPTQPIANAGASSPKMSATATNNNFTGSGSPLQQNKVESTSPPKPQPKFGLSAAPKQPTSPVLPKITETQQLSGNGKNESKKLLLEKISMELTLGTDQDSSLFNALAQSINKTKNTNVNTTESLQKLCRDFYAKNKDLVDGWNNKPFTKPVPYEAKGLGKPNVETRIACRHLNFKAVFIIEVEGTAANNSTVNFYLADQNNYEKISDEKAQGWLKDLQVPVVVLEQNKFAPVLNRVECTQKLSISSPTL